jgi:hypothetical protein
MKAISNAQTGQGDDQRKTGQPAEREQKASSTGSAMMQEA